MSNAKHTPGPWSYWPSVAYAEGVITRDATLGHIATPAVMGDRGVMIANARLIAAAPDLLDALRALLPFAMEIVNKNHSSVINACAAIAKAEGRAA